MAPSVNRRVSVRGTVERGRLQRTFQPDDRCCRYPHVSRRRRVCWYKRSGLLRARQSQVSLQSCSGRFFIMVIMTMWSRHSYSHAIFYHSLYQSWSLLSEWTHHEGLFTPRNSATVTVTLTGGTFEDQSATRQCYGDHRGITNCEWTLRVKVLHSITLCVNDKL